MDIEDIISNLKSIGVIFYSKKNHTIYIADEIVRILRKMRGKDLADKYLRRILRVLRPSELNMIAKQHNIDRKLKIEDKIETIIKAGVSIHTILGNDIYKEETTLSERKRFINHLWKDRLKIKSDLGGFTINEKIKNIISYFDQIERDTKVGISIDGYEKMLVELNESLPNLNMHVKNIFELQEDFVLSGEFLLNFNIKPIDILDIIDHDDLISFCKIRNIKTRGNVISNILNQYKDAENLYLENYEYFGYRDLKTLKENGIVIKESQLGIKFEFLTKKIFTDLGFNVDEKLRKELNTKKDKIDIVINLGNNELIIIECKTIKDSGYNKFSTVSRQLKSYNNLAIRNNYHVRKLLLIAPEFSDEFIEECELDIDLDLSLLTAAALKKIYDGFKRSKYKLFPQKLIMRDVVINPERIVKAISKN